MAKKGGARTCGHCKKPGHSKRTCPGLATARRTPSASPAVRVIDKELERRAKELAQAQSAVDGLMDQINKLRDAREVLA
jgi:hypothetical protein